MQRLCLCLATVLVAASDPLTAGQSWPSLQPADLTNGYSLHLSTPAAYLPDLPIPVRLEVRDAAGRRPWGLWEFDATLAVDVPNVYLSTNRIRLRHGIGSTLVGIQGGGTLSLSATLGPLTTRKSLVDVTPTTPLSVGGTLAGSSTVWSNLVLITNDLVVPSGHTLTIQSNTLVLVAGATSGTTAPDLIVNGSVQCLGTAEAPVVFTCSRTDANWGQLRHDNAQPSLYRHTFIHRGGRATPEGHTGTGPLIRTANSILRFEHCAFTDVSVQSPANTTGKILYGVGGIAADLVFDDCLWARARMGPEISGSSVLVTNCHVSEMLGPDDADGIYLHAQGTGKTILLTDSVWAGGEDDGIDTLDSTVTITNCLVRGWNNPSEDAKGVTIFGGETRLRNSLVVDCAIAISSKASNGGTVTTRIDGCTIVGLDRGIAAENKGGTAPDATVRYFVTNTIALATRTPDNALYTDYNPTNIVVHFSLLGESWAGTGNQAADPRFVNPAAFDFRLQPASPAIDTGDPARPPDADRSPCDRGYFTFLPEPPRLEAPRISDADEFLFTLAAYPGRAYVVERSANLVDWTAWRTNFQSSDTTIVVDPGPSKVGTLTYRARVIPP